MTLVSSPDLSPVVLNQRVTDMYPQDLSEPGGSGRETPRFLYLVHDLADPAVRRRLMMFQAGGAKVTIAGFRRSQEPVALVEDSAPIELGQTENGNFIQRAVAVAKSTLSIRGKFGHLTKPDVIIARNLEMLAVAVRLKAFFGSPDIKIAYECLDIHRLMLRKDRMGRALRGLEKRLLKNVSIIITSSPAFVRNYFRPLADVTQPIEIVENKHLELVDRSATDGRDAGARSNGPWKIGWFGALRCKRSLEVLSQFTQEQQGKFQIVLRGIPSLDVFPDFHDFVKAQPHMSFEGRYKNPEDLSAIYEDVHFSWVIDLFEAGQNSAWLLPNRLYEGCRFAAVPIAVKNTETAEFLSSMIIGIAMEELSVSELSRVLGTLTSEQYCAHRNAVTALPKKLWICDLKDCEALVTKIAGSMVARHSNVPEIPASASLERT